MRTVAQSIRACIEAQLSIDARIASRLGDVKACHKRNVQKQHLSILQQRRGEGSKATQTEDIKQVGQALQPRDGKDTIDAACARQPARVAASNPQPASKPSERAPRSRGRTQALRDEDLGPAAPPTVASKARKADRRPAYRSAFLEWVRGKFETKYWHYFHSLPEDEGQLAKVKSTRVRRHDAYVDTIPQLTKLVLSTWSSSEGLTAEDRAQRNADVLSLLREWGAQRLRLTWGLGRNWSIESRENVLAWHHLRGHDHDRALHFLAYHTRRLEAELLYGPGALPSVNEAASSASGTTYAGSEAHQSRQHSLTASDALPNADASSSQDVSPLPPYRPFFDRDLPYESGKPPYYDVSETYPGTDEETFMLRLGVVVRVAEFPLRFWRELHRNLIVRVRADDFERLLAALRNGTALPPDLPPALVPAWLHALERVGRHLPPSLVLSILDASTLMLTHFEESHRCLRVAENELAFRLNDCTQWGTAVPLVAPPHIPCDIDSDFWLSNDSQSDYAPQDTEAAAQGHFPADAATRHASQLARKVEGERGGVAVDALSRSGVKALRADLVRHALRRARLDMHVEALDGEDRMRLVALARRLTLMSRTDPSDRGDAFGFARARQSGLESLWRVTLNTHDLPALDAQEVRARGARGLVDCAAAARADQASHVHDQPLGSEPSYHNMRRWWLWWPQQWIWAFWLHTWFRHAAQCVARSDWDSGAGGSERSTALSEAAVLVTWGQEVVQVVPGPWLDSSLLLLHEIEAKLSRSAAPVAASTPSVSPNASAEEPTVDAAALLTVAKAAANARLPVPALHSALQHALPPLSIAAANPDVFARHFAAAAAAATSPARSSSSDVQRTRSVVNALARHRLSGGLLRDLTTDQILDLSSALALDLLQPKSGAADQASERDGRIGVEASLAHRRQRRAPERQKNVSELVMLLASYEDVSGGDVEAAASLAKQSDGTALTQQLSALGRIISALVQVCPQQAQNLEELMNPELINMACTEAARSLALAPVCVPAEDAFPVPPALAGLTAALLHTAEQHGPRCTLEITHASFAAALRPSDSRKVPRVVAHLEPCRHGCPSLHSVMYLAGDGSHADVVEASGSVKSASWPQQLVQPWLAAQSTSLNADVADADAPVPATTNADTVPAARQDNSSQEVLEDGAKFRQRWRRGAKVSVVAPRLLPEAGTVDLDGELAQFTALRLISSGRWLKPRDLAARWQNAFDERAQMRFADEVAVLRRAATLHGHAEAASVRDAFTADTSDSADMARVDGAACDVAAPVTLLFTDRGDLITSETPARPTPALRLLQWHLYTEGGRAAGVPAVAIDGGLWRAASLSQRAAILRKAACWRPDGASDLPAWAAPVISAHADAVASESHVLPPSMGEASLDAMRVVLVTE